jgi:hypothetical protein
MKLSQQLPLGTLLGCSLLLLLLLLTITTTTTLTLAQDFTATTAIICDPAPGAENGCDIDQYCSATSSTCIAIGSCADDNVADCNNLNNGPYPALMCIGTMECKEGMCLMNCETSSTSCNTSAECISVVDSENNSNLSESFMDGEYCGTDSTCLSMGDCLVIDDCMNSDNVFPVAACMVSFFLFFLFCL